MLKRILGTVLTAMAVVLMVFSPAIGGTERSHNVFESAVMGAVLGGILGLCIWVWRKIKKKPGVKDAQTMRQALNWLWTGTWEDRNLRKEQDNPPNAEPLSEEIAGLSITNVSHIKKPVWGSKFSILLMIFLVAGVVGGIGLFYLVSDREEDARNKLIEMNISFNNDTFFEKIIVGDVVAVRLFLKAGVSPNSKLESGWSALMLASDHGQQSVAEVLLKNGADINMWDQGGNTAFDLAKEKGHINLAKFLRLKGGLTGKEVSIKRIEEEVQRLQR